MYYIIQCQFEEVVSGEVRRHMPLHMTLMHWFTFDDSYEQRLIDALTNVNAKSFQITAYENALFGRNYDIPVTKIQKSSVLIDLHMSVYLLLQGLGAVFTDPDFVGAGYSPHSSHKGDEKLLPGDQINISSFTLLKATEPSPGSEKTVVHTIGL